MSDSEVASESYVHYLTQWKIVGNSEVHTLPYPDGVVLPTGYKRCKYLEFKGTQYFDTGIIPEQGISVYAKYTHISLSGDSGVFGCREGPWSSDSLYVFRQLVSTVNFISYGGIVANNNTASNPTIAAGDNIELELDSTKCVIKINGQTYNMSHNCTITKGTKTIYLGKINGYGNLLIGKVYEFVLYGSNSLPIFNGIPCLDDNDVPCLYDTVSGTSFYNEGRDTFGYELYPQPTEIWSCGEYNPIDGKYHILVQPQGGSIVDIALTEPLRKVNDVADTIEFPSGTDGKALVTRNLGGDKLGNFTWNATITSNNNLLKRWSSDSLKDVITGSSVILTIEYTKGNTWNRIDKTYSYDSNNFFIYDKDYNTVDSYNDFIAHINNYDIIYKLATPTTELVDAPQIAEAESYSCIISQGGKAVNWSSFETE